MENISIIIPALNEEEVVGRTLDALASIGEMVEVIVADGGSVDSTKTLAATLSRVIDAPRGRARQMNAGAKAASGDILLFLHADSVLPEGAFGEIRRILSDPAVAGGGFSLRFDDPAYSFRLIENGSNWRARCLGLVFGDQGIFVRRSVFERLNGFREITLMEDWDFSRRLGREGRVVVSVLPITTSSRRFRRYGVWRTVWRMQVIKALYLLGVAPERLSRIYEKRP
ncbi:MAG: TIGR04283 family arsenosugar biosynthesis glycosyltransferase [Nitrospirota bacterium]|nr:TIGR04283 family arsenosugar biosynthesis glycosyltransferase [Nitrospirota bacterium]